MLHLRSSEHHITRRLTFFSDLSFELRWPPAAHVAVDLNESQWIGSRLYGRRPRSAVALTPRSNSSLLNGFLDSSEPGLRFSRESYDRVRRYRPLPFA